MSKKTISPQDMERHAQALQRAKEHGSLPAEDLRRLHEAFVATDYAGQRWSVGLKTGAWSRFEDGEWKRATPPERLHLEESLIAEIGALEHGAGSRAADAARVRAAAPGAGPSPAGASAPAGRRCPACQARLGDDEAFCPNDGTPVPLPEPGEEPAPARAGGGAGPPVRSVASEPPGPKTAPRVRSEPSPVRLPPLGTGGPQGDAPPTDWAPVVLCLGIALVFAAGGWTRGSTGAYVLAVFFAALAVIIVFLNRPPRRA